MAFRQVFKVSRKTFFNPSAWLDTNSIRTYTLTIWDILRGMFIPPQPARAETFEEATKRLGLTKEDIKTAERNYYLFSLVFLTLGVITFIFAFYLIFVHATFAGWLIAIAVSGLFLAQAFRYHFWYFQIKFRKLGCTFEEWKRGKPFDKDRT